MPWMEHRDRCRCGFSAKLSGHEGGHSALLNLKRYGSSLKLSSSVQINHLCFAETVPDKLQNEKGQLTVMKAFQGYTYIGMSLGIAMRNVLTEGMKMHIFEMVCTVERHSYWDYSAEVTWTRKTTRISSNSELKVRTHSCLFHVISVLLTTQSKKLSSIPNAQMTQMFTAQIPSKY